MSLDPRATGLSTLPAVPHTLPVPTGPAGPIPPKPEAPGKKPEPLARPRAADRAARPEPMGRKAQVCSRMDRAMLGFTGLLAGIAVGIFHRKGLEALGLSAALGTPSTLFVTLAWGLSLPMAMRKLMQRAQQGTKTIEVEGKPKEIPLRRRKDLLQRALFHLSLMGLGFGISFAAIWTLLVRFVPSFASLEWQFGAADQAHALALGSILLSLAFCELHFSRVRRKGDQGAALSLFGMALVGQVLVLARAL